ncbi:MAG TPA: DHA2 family efflux MFS transporter permease subunit [Nocardioides sp.]|jgi:EmrB/QacA subfamily drug resistance transporter|uniref:DHA2 family efflux MFS transporter permease subunit n=1 Tax=Nocardioides sp. TaxID=35761 RepID=UPI002E2FEE03|nr:DHA2 family efflux MFS transporter permease subunit [Nocardioides sp.]HEX3930155.1 DHA2 family efflux MFS transporter permease subunit [Nocardioides sp.]
MSSKEHPSTTRLTVLLTAGAYLLVTLDALVVVTALPSIHADLGGGGGSLPWIINAYALTFAAGIIAASALGDRLGRARMYAAGLVLFSLASAACALAPGLGLLIAFRAVQGLGAAVVMPLGLTLLTSSFAAERRGAVVGIWGGVAGLGVASGPLVGGAVTEGLDWHWIFWVNVPLGLAAAVAVLRTLPVTYGPRTRLDPLGIVTASGAMAALVWGVLRAPDSGWGSGEVLVALVAGAVLLGAFVAWQAVAPEPMVPLALFRSQVFSAAASTQFLMAASIFATAYLTSEFFQVSRGDSPLAAGVGFLPWTMTPLVVAPLAGRLVDRIGARALAAPGLALQAVGFVWLLHEAHDHATYGAFVVPFVVAGVGISMALPSASAAGLNAAPPALLGRAAGVLNTVQQVGQAAGVAVVTAVFDAHGSLATPAATLSGYEPALVTAAAISLLGALTALAIGRPPGRPLVTPDNADPALRHAEIG